MRWTVDDPADLELVRLIYRALNNDDFGMDDVLDMLERRPDLLGHASKAERNEGYAKSLREDRVV